MVMTSIRNLIRLIDFLQRSFLIPFLINRFFWIYFKMFLKINLLGSFRNLFFLIFLILLGLKFMALWLSPCGRNINEVGVRALFFHNFGLVLAGLLPSQFICISHFVFHQNVIILLNIRIESVFNSILRSAR